MSADCSRMCVCGCVHPANRMVDVWMSRGPEDTPYEGGVFPAVLTFPQDYPLSPPQMKFTCPMFHPNGLFFCRQSLLGGVDGLHGDALHSVSERCCVHIDPAPARRRPKHVRKQLGAMEPSAECGEDPVVCHEHDCWYDLPTQRVAHADAHHCDPW